MMTQAGLDTDCLRAFPAQTRGAGWVALLPYLSSLARMLAPLIFSAMVRVLPRRCVAHTLTGRATFINGLVI